VFGSRSSNAQHALLAAAPDLSPNAAEPRASRAWPANRRATSTCQCSFRPSPFPIWTDRSG